jgi:hypothetical protein
VPFFVIFRDFWPKFGILVVKTPIPETQQYVTHGGGGGGGARTYVIYFVQLRIAGNVTRLDPVLSISKRIEEREKQCKIKQQIDEMRTYLAFRYI